MKDAIDKKLIVRIIGKNNTTWHRYKVIGITGASTNVPNADSPTVFMELAERNPGHLQTFISLPISAFESRVLAESKEDYFWNPKKQMPDANDQ